MDEDLFLKLQSELDNWVQNNRANEEEENEGNYDPMDDEDERSLEDSEDFYIAALIDSIVEGNSLALIESVMSRCSNVILSILEATSEEIDFLDGIDHKGRTALHYAILYAKENWISFLLQQGASTRMRDKKGFIPLHLASICKKNASTFIDLLIDFDSPIDFGDHQQRTPLHLACLMENKEAVIKLIERGASRFSVDQNLLTPLHYSLFYPNFFIISHLFTFNQPKEGDEESYIENEDFNEKKGKNNMGENKLNVKDKWGRTALHYAMFYCTPRQLSSLKLIIDSFHDVNCLDSDLRSPLFWGILGAKAKDCIKELMEKGGDIKIKDINGATVLHWACHFNQVDLLQLLIDFAIQKGEKIEEIINLIDNKGRSLLHAGYQHKNIILYLLSKKIDVKIADFEKHQTPLHLMLIHRLYDHFMILVDYLNDNQIDFDINCVDYSGKSLLLYTPFFTNFTEKNNFYVNNNNNNNIRIEEWDYQRIVNEIKEDKEKGEEDQSCQIFKKLVKLGADMKVKNNRSQNILFIATKCGNLDVIKLIRELINNDNNFDEMIKEEDYKGRSAFHISAGMKFHQILRYFLQFQPALIQTTEGMSGGNSLHFSAFSGDPLSLSLLLSVYHRFEQEIGDDKNDWKRGWKDGRGRSVLHSAAASSSIPCYLLIYNYISKSPIDHSSDFKDDEGRLPIFYCTNSSFFDFLLTNPSLLSPLCLSSQLNINVNELRDDKGRSVLHSYVEEGNKEVIKYLLKEKLIDVNVKDKEKRTPLHFAAYYSRSNLIQLLHRYRANINDEDVYHKTPLYYATLVRSIASIELLISTSDLHSLLQFTAHHPFLLACSRADYPSILLYFEHLFSSILSQFYDKEKEKRGKNGLHLFAQSNEIHHLSTNQIEEIVSILIKIFEINQCDERGRNSLHLSIVSQNYSLVKILIDNHININQEEDHGITPLMLAYYLNLPSIVSQLLSVKADQTSIDHFNRSVDDYRQLHSSSHSSCKFPLIPSDKKSFPIENQESINENNLNDNNNNNNNSTREITHENNNLTDIHNIDGNNNENNKNNYSDYIDNDVNILNSKKEILNNGVEIEEINNYKNRILELEREMTELQISAANKLLKQQEEIIRLKDSLLSANQLHLSNFHPKEKIKTDQPSLDIHLTDKTLIYSNNNDNNNNNNNNNNNDSTERKDFLSILLTENEKLKSQIIEFTNKDEDNRMLIESLRGDNYLLNLQNEYKQSVINKLLSEREIWKMEESSLLRRFFYGIALTKKANLPYHKQNEVALDSLYDLIRQSDVSPLHWEKWIHDYFDHLSSCEESTQL